MNIAKEDWDALQALAERMGLPIEEVALLRRRADPSRPRPGRPYSMLVGRPNGRIELLLARWLAAAVTEELKKAGDQPLILGPSPSELRPRLTAWPIYRWPSFQPGHLIALRAAGKLAPDIAAQLASLGYVEQVVLVTSLGQPMHQEERELARSMAALAATARVLVVGLTGEEPTSQDLIEVSTLAMSHMREAGFRNGRCLGAGVWLADSKSPPPGTITEVAGFFVLNEDDVARGRSGMLQRSVHQLMDKFRNALAVSSERPAPQIPDEECVRLRDELLIYLAALGREVARLTDVRRLTSTDAIRSYVLNVVRGWGASSSPEDHWMRYVTRLRPGIQGQFQTAAQEALAYCRCETVAGEAPVEAALLSESIVDRAILEAKRAGIGLLVGFIVYRLASFLLSDHPWIVGWTGRGVAFPPLLVSLVGAVAFLIGSLLGYAGSRRFISAASRGAIEGSPTQELYGWNETERRMTRWFAENINRASPSAATLWADLAVRLGIEEKLT